MSNYEESIAHTMDDQKYLIFYHLMKYPVPQHSSYFLLEKKGRKKQEDILRGNEFPPDTQRFSWDHKNEYMDEYVAFIQKYQRLYRSIPFIHSIYLCNSITFNGLHDDSDIDIFIVTKR